MTVSSWQASLVEVVGSHRTVLPVFNKKTFVLVIKQQ